MAKEYHIEEYHLPPPLDHEIRYRIVTVLGGVRHVSSDGQDDCRTRAEAEAKIAQRRLRDQE